MTFRERLKAGIIFLDGGMGTGLQAKGMGLGELPELWNLTKPEIITEIHRQFAKAGAEVLYTNTFGANRYKLQRTGHTVEEVVKAAVKNAKKAAEEAGGQERYIALDLSSVGKLMEPAGSFTFEEAYEAFREQILAGKDADCIVIETMTDLLEIKAAVLAAKENSTLPVIATMSFEANGRTFTGCTPEAAALTLTGLGVDALGANCSVGPEEMADIMERMAAHTDLPLVIKPNAGLPDPETGTFPLSPEQFAGYMSAFVKIGIRLYGGCCGTLPEHISAMRKTIEEEAKKTKEIYRRNVSRCPVLCSASRIVTLSEPRIIGERINPTGKKLMKEALRNNNMDYLLAEAEEQTKAGAEILDVNVGLPGIDEKAMMVRAVIELQSVTDAPLQIDSTDPGVLEAALRVYRGKPIVNSVNGEQEVLDRILPIVKKYGAAVVGLTLDSRGIPKTAAERVKIAEHIVREAKRQGIPRTDVFIDCLTLTVSAEQEGATETLRAVTAVKEQLQVKTVLGVSNISFGLPNRELINRTFLTMALEHGLDLPIINPKSEAMTGAVRAYKLLYNIDKGAVQFVESYAEQELKNKGVTIQESSGRVSAEDAGPQTRDILKSAVLRGLGNDAAQATEELLKTGDSMEIVDTVLIPALDEVGAKFESGALFLPQLMRAAAASQACFEVIRRHLLASGRTEENKGTIVLATVKGDIHDIGKNIVKVLLENYGFQVEDLGKDVAPELVVEAVKKSGARLAGLSALMTTTVVSMEETIRQLRAEVPDCKIMVGGAVLTYEHAMKIGADYYCKDAKESADRAREVYKQKL